MHVSVRSHFMTVVLLLFLKQGAKFRLLFCIDVDLEAIARATTGFTGADLANLINQAALRGCVEDKDAVTNEDLEYARY